MTTEPRIFSAAAKVAQNVDTDELRLMLVTT